MLSFKIILAVLFAIVLVILGYSVTSTFTVGVPLIVDGHTFIIDDELVELEGIATPSRNELCVRNEVEWPCGLLSTASLSSIVGNRSVWCIERSRRTDNRVVSTCYQGIKDVAEAQVAIGWAQQVGGPIPKYAREQEKAKRRGLGMWRQHALVAG